MKVKLSEYAKINALSYRAVWNRYKAGKIPNASMNELGHIVVEIDQDKVDANKVAIYARVSSSENKDNLAAQVDRLTQYAIAKGYQIVSTYSEVGSGVNDKRPKLEKLLTENNYSKIIVEHKDRLTRVGFNYIETLLKNRGKEIEVVNLSTNDESNLMEDLISIIYSFSARMYGLRQSTRKTEKIIEVLNQKDDNV